MVETQLRSRHIKDPRVLAADLVNHFRSATDSVVNFQFVETIDATRLFTIMDGSYLTISRYAELLHEPGWTTLRAASDSGKISFDLEKELRKRGFDLQFPEVHFAVGLWTPQPADKGQIRFRHLPATDIPIRSHLPLRRKSRLR